MTLGQRLRASPAALQAEGREIEPAGFDFPKPTPSATLFSNKALPPNTSKTVYHFESSTKIYEPIGVIYTQSATIEKSPILYKTI